VRRNLKMPPVSNSTVETPAASEDHRAQPGRSVQPIFSATDRFMPAVNTDIVIELQVAGGLRDTRGDGSRRPDPAD
jgi:hypothetical protein